MAPLGPVSMLFFRTAALLALSVLPAFSHPLQGGPGDGQPGPGGGPGGTPRGGAGDRVPLGGLETPGTPRRSSGPSSPIGGDPGTPGGSSRPSPTTPTSVRWAGANPIGPEGWWTWWQLHELDFLRPNLLHNWVRVVSGYGDATISPRRALEHVRASLSPLLRAGLSDGDPLVRGAAALAYGRITAGPAETELAALLEDPSLEVRERALLALGATGSREAGGRLLAFARAERRSARSRRTVHPQVRSIAVFALSIGRRNGMGAWVDDGVVELARSLDPTRHDELASAILMYQTIQPCAELDAWVLERALDARGSTVVRARALETLRTRSGDDRALVALIEALGGSQLELRRSAALALGEFEHPLALPRLLAAAEREGEPMTRGFMLISIGRQGGAEAREYLADLLANGVRAMRPWGALALGILARLDDDEAAREVLRTSLAQEHSQYALGAFHLALGIALDRTSEGVLARALIEQSTPESRAVAATGLAMLGTPTAGATLRRRFSEEPNSITRAAIARALGFIGDPADVPALAAETLPASAQDLRHSAVSALGWHGTRQGLERLITIATDADENSAIRSHALEAAQIVLGRQPSLTVPELLRQANFSVFPPTLVRLMAVPL